MNKKLIASALGLLLASMPMANANAETFNIYGWQNWSYEWVDVENGKDIDRLSNNSASIGFDAQLPTGIAGLEVGFKCESGTRFSRNNHYGFLCNRESKLSLIHETMGEIMVGQWLLPFNQIVAQWIDPFYDAGADSHTSIMGNIGGGPGRDGFSDLYYGPGFDQDFTDTYGSLTFNRRQEGIVQYVWPNTAVMGSQTREGFQFRVAATDGNNTDSSVDLNGKTTAGGEETLDERILSTGVSYQKAIGNGMLWVAAAYEKHEDVSARAGIGGVKCGESDDEGRRIAGRYSHDWGNGMKTQLGVMYEELEYDADNCTDGTNPVTPIWSDVDRDAWMVSGKHSFGNGLDVRFSYMDADEYDCGSTNAACSAIEDGTDADSYNIGMFYTLPAGTEFRVTYTEVNNGRNSEYDLGIGEARTTVGNDVEMVAIGIVQWFD